MITRNIKIKPTAVAIREPLSVSAIAARSASWAGMIVVLLRS